MKRKPTPAIKQAAEFVRRAQAIKAGLGVAMPAPSAASNSKVQFSLRSENLVQRLRAMKANEVER